MAMNICFLYHGNRVLSTGCAPTTHGARLAALQALSATHGDLPVRECQYRVFLAYTSVSTTNTTGHNQHAH
jgi:hypothetical protein